ncbi:cell envelope integrity protein CreD [Algibacillus agarilyticus]|uniref:cell envelope integrity protein CreD n=1 Tax=Algibacillus agarilyticus TaxID=2234133 RepID=UPI000DD05E8A|nr:cell envelope integrity protein CreD [Algibacillus agarilyticus]
MQKPLLTKLVVISVITLLLLIPLSMISGQINDRQHYLIDAQTSVANSWTGEQKITGPILVVPYTAYRYVETWNETKEKLIQRKDAYHKFLFVKPETLHFDVQTQNDIRYKGIYAIPVYTSNLMIKGQLSPQAIQTKLTTIKQDYDEVEFENAFLSVLISDPRGINRVPTLNFNQQTINFKPGSQLSVHSNGIHAPLDVDLQNLQAKNEFDFSLEIRGMKQLSFVPVGESIQVVAQSNWPHPEFTGQFLPVQRTINNEGYRAQWKITSFANNIQQKLENCAAGSCKALLATDFGVKHIEAVDVYLQSERSIKYGVLFIALSFIAFFLFEVVQKLRIHGIQYALVGLAIASFFLLLVSLSEHIAFVWAYTIAAFACISLLVVYISNILASLSHALGFGLAMSLLYAALFVIISAEDTALLMGSGLTFGLLAMLMMATRKIDWYQVSEELSAKAKIATKPAEKSTTEPANTESNT